MNAKLFTLIISALAVMGGVMGMVSMSEDSEGASLPGHNYSVTALHKSYYTNSPAESFYLASVGGNDVKAYAEMIGGSHMQGNLSVDRSGAPSWITYELFSNRYDVRFTVAPGAPVDDTFWILFNCMGGSVKILVLFDIEVIDSGSVIPDPDMNTFTLKFDTGGGSVVPNYSAETDADTYTFDLSKVDGPTRDGFKFTGWSSDSAGQSVIINNKWTMTITSGNTATATLYAVWEESEGPEDIWIPIKGVFDFLLEFFSNTELMMILGGGLISVALVFRAIRNRRLE